MIALLLIIITIYISYLKTTITLPYRFILNIIQFICPFLFIITFIGIVYKYIIPVKIAFKKTLKTSASITALIFLITIIYQQVLIKISSNHYQNMYGIFAGSISFLIWLYIICYIFLMGIAIILLKEEYKTLTNDI